MDYQAEDITAYARAAGLTLKKGGSIGGRPMWVLLDENNECLHGSPSLDNIKWWLDIYGAGYKAGIRRATKILHEEAPPVVKLGQGDSERTWPAEDK